MLSWLMCGGGHCCRASKDSDKCVSVDLSCPMGELCPETARSGQSSECGGDARLPAAVSARCGPPEPPEKAGTGRRSPTDARRQQRCSTEVVDEGCHTSRIVFSSASPGAGKVPPVESAPIEGDGSPTLLVGRRLRGMAAVRVEGCDPLPLPRPHARSRMSTWSTIAPTEFDRSCSGDSSPTASPPALPDAGAAPGAAEPPVGATLSSSSRGGGEPAAGAAAGEDVARDEEGDEAEGGDASPISHELGTADDSASAADDEKDGFLSEEGSVSDEPPISTARRVKADRDRALWAKRQKLKLRCFFATSGFRSVNEQKRRSKLSSGFTFPLHAAVVANDFAAVEALVWAGGDKRKKDSQQMTPLDLARRLNRDGSHYRIIHFLCG